MRRFGGTVEQRDHVTWVIQPGRYRGTDVAIEPDACVATYLWASFFQAEDGIRDGCVTGVQTCALPISPRRRRTLAPRPCITERPSRPRPRGRPGFAGAGPVVGGEPAHVGGAPPEGDRGHVFVRRRAP